MKRSRLLLRGITTSAVALLAGACIAGNSTSAKAADFCEARGSAHAVEMQHDGHDRSYRYFVPKTSGDKRLPIVIALHGGLGTGESMAEQTKLDAAATRHGFAVVYPDGLYRSWNAGSCCGPPAKNNIDDVGFIRQVVNTLRGESCLDGDRVFATGFSNGAMLTHRIACEAPELLTAIAPVSGGPMIDSCPKAKSIPALLLVGKADERIPWNGGMFKETYRPSIAEQVKTLTSRNRCGDGERTLKGSGGFCSRRAGCEDGAVSWCIIDGVGHQWPGGKTIFQRLLGPNRDVIDASDLILRFFSTQE